MADALSRSPVFDPEPEEEQDILACSVVVSWRVEEASEEASKTDLAIEALAKHAVNDQEWNKVYHAIKKRMELRNLPKDNPAHQSMTGVYQSYWDALSTEETLPNILLFHGRIFVSSSAQAEILKTLHMNHCGLAKSLANARQLYLWSRMAKDIQNDIEKSWGSGTWNPEG